MSSVFALPATIVSILLGFSLSALAASAAETSPTPQSTASPTATGSPSIAPTPTPTPPTVTTSNAIPTPDPDQPCEQEKDGVKFICGVINTEDWAPIENSPWIIGSHYNAAGKAGYLMIFDSGALTAQTVEPQQIKTGSVESKYKSCPGAPDFTALSSHGLAVRKTSATSATLYVVNHGGRESIEVFDVEIPKPSVPGGEVKENPIGVSAITKPELTWKGCVVAPKNTYPDAVAPLSDGSLVVTSLWNPNDKARMEKLKAGQPMGGLFKWNSGNWSEIAAGKKLSAPNGLVASADGKYAYVAVWAGKSIAKVSLNKNDGAKSPELVSTGFYTDNLRWSPDGKTIYAGGQSAPMATVLGCIDADRKNCDDVPFAIDALNPDTMKLTPLVKPGVYGGLGAGTGAIRVGDELWVSSFHADRVARFPAAGNVVPPAVPTPVSN